MQTLLQICTNCQETMPAPTLCNFKQPAASRTLALPLLPPPLTPRRWSINISTVTATTSPHCSHQVCHSTRPASSLHLLHDILKYVLADAAATNCRTMQWQHSPYLPAPRYCWWRRWPVGWWHALYPQPKRRFGCRRVRLQMCRYKSIEVVFCPPRIHISSSIPHQTTKITYYSSPSDSSASHPP